MLVLSRKRQESLRIGSDVEIVVLGMGTNRVRLGICCPEVMAVRREERMKSEEADLKTSSEQESDLVSGEALVSAGGQ